MSYDLIKNFKQGRIADTRENVEIIQQKVEEHDSQISQQIVFSKIESLDANDNLYHSIIKVNDGSASLEVVDKADEDTSDGKMTVVGLNMYKSSIATLMNDVEALKNKFTIYEPALAPLMEKYEYEQNLTKWIGMFEEGQGQCDTTIREAAEMKKAYEGMKEHSFNLSDLERQFLMKYIEDNVYLLESDNETKTLADLMRPIWAMDVEEEIPVKITLKWTLNFYNWLLTSISDNEKERTGNIETIIVFP